jgi:hypothetical protein
MTKNTTPQRPGDLDLPPLTLDTLGKGAAKELFAQELDRVLENILDPNTEPVAKREITLKVTFRPSDDRREVETEVEASSKLAAFRGAGGVIFVGRRAGRAVSSVYDPKQMGLFDVEQPRLVDDKPAAPVAAGGR